MVPSSSLVSLLLAAVLLVGFSPSQQPDADPTAVLATFQLPDRLGYVTRTDVALEMAFHLRRRDEGRQAVDLLVDSELTREQAAAQNLLPTTAELRAYWASLQQQLRAAGRNPQDIAAVRNMSETQLLDYCSVQLAQERLVRKELALGPGEAVSGDMQKLWMQEARKRAKIETNPDRLPAGTACMVQDRAVSMARLGELLLQTSDEEQVQEFVQQVAFLLTVEAMGKTHQLQVTEADLDAAIEQRKRDAQNDPRYRGMGFEQLLESQGFTTQTLRELRVFRCKTLLPKLASKLTPDAELRRALSEERSKVLLQVGPRRRIGVIFSRASESPNALIPNDFAAAHNKLRAAKLRIAKDGFALVARIESDEPITKARGGDAGWHQQDSTSLPAFVIQAAFQLAMGEISEPLRGEDGCYLITNLETEAEPDDQALLQRLRERSTDDLKRKIVKDLALKRSSATASAPK